MEGGRSRLRAEQGPTRGTADTAPNPAAPTWLMSRLCLHRITARGLLTSGALGRSPATAGPTSSPSRCPVVARPPRPVSHTHTHCGHPRGRFHLHAQHIRKERPPVGPGPWGMEGTQGRTRQMLLPGGGPGSPGALPACAVGGELGRGLMTGPRVPHGDLSWSQETPKWPSPRRAPGSLNLPSCGARGRTPGVHRHVRVL